MFVFKWLSSLLLNRIQLKIVLRFVSRFCGYDFRFIIVNKAFLMSNISLYESPTWYRHGLTDHQSMGHKEKCIHLAYYTSEELNMCII